MVNRQSMSWKAGLLSCVFPGLGHFYSSRKATGLVLMVLPVIVATAFVIAGEAKLSHLRLLAVAASTIWVTQLAFAVIASRRAPPGAGQPRTSTLVALAVVSVLVNTSAITLYAIESLGSDHFLAHFINRNRAVLIGVKGNHSNSHLRLFRTLENRTKSLVVDTPNPIGKFGQNYGPQTFTLSNGSSILAKSDLMNTNWWHAHCVVAYAYTNTSSKILIFGPDGPDGEWSPAQSCPAVPLREIGLHQSGK